MYVRKTVNDKKGALRRAVCASVYIYPWEILTPLQIVSSLDSKTKSNLAQTVLKIQQSFGLTLVGNDNSRFMGRVALLVRIHRFHSHHFVHDWHIFSDDMCEKKAVKRRMGMCKNKAMKMRMRMKKTMTKNRCRSLQDLIRGLARKSRDGETTSTMMIGGGSFLFLHVGHWTNIWYI